jgi:TPR repeat protein
MTDGMAQAEKENNKSAKNPLLWVSLIVIGLIIYIFIASDRGTVTGQKEEFNDAADSTIPVQEGEISRDAIVPPGMRAREYIQQLREQGKPYPFEEVMAKAADFSSEGSLADAHLVYFFAAKEGYVDAMMIMAEMSDPTRFRADDNLMDEPDAVQAYKWYSQSLQKGFEPARIRLENLHQWATAEARYGNATAQQLLLNFN